ncbi:MAG: NAD-dependent epimerase/dehydratase family protein [Victivallales bacterium]|nr:NAD-dependent epimerase/dehydratase family protein [Victivallales bacterium]
MANILLMGGTGAMGVYLRQILVERGDNVFVTTRAEHRDEKGIRFLQGNAHDLDFLKRIVAETKPDAMVDFMIYYTESFRRRVQTLLSMSPQYVFISSYRVFAEAEPIVEDSPRLLDVIEDETYLKTDEYALTKARQEDALRSSGKHNWTIVRPAITYSKERFQFGVLEAPIICWRALHNLPVIMPRQMLDHQTTMTWGGDVARMIAGLTGNPLALGEDFNCATAEHHTWREVAEIYGRAIGLRVFPCTVEEYIWGPNKYQIMYDRMFNRVMDNSKVLRVTGIKQDSFVSLEDGLSRELAEFKEHPHYKWQDPGRQATMDRLTKTRAPLSAFSPSERELYLKARYPALFNSLPIRAVRKLRSLAKKVFHI